MVLVHTKIPTRRLIHIYTTPHHLIKLSSSRQIERKLRYDDERKVYTCVCVYIALCISTASQFSHRILSFFPVRVWLVFAKCLLLCKLKVGRSSMAFPDSPTYTYIYRLHIMIMTMMIIISCKKWHENDAKICMESLPIKMNLLLLLLICIFGSGSRFYKLCIIISS